MSDCGSLSSVSAVQSHTPAGTSHRLHLDASKRRRAGSCGSTSVASSTPMQRLMCSADRCCSGQGDSVAVLLLLAAWLGGPKARCCFWPTSSMGKSHETISKPVSSSCSSPSKPGLIRSLLLLLLPSLLSWLATEARKVVDAALSCCSCHSASCLNTLRQSCRFSTRRRCMELGCALHQGVDGLLLLLGVVCRAAKPASRDCAALCGPATATLPWVPACHNTWERE
jgi:hypothetical protein